MLAELLVNMLVKSLVNLFAESLVNMFVESLANLLANLFVNMLVESLVNAAAKSQISMLVESQVNMWAKSPVNLLVESLVNMSALQIRVGQRSVTANLWPLTAHFYHVMIIVTGDFSKKSFLLLLLLFCINSFARSWTCFLGIVKHWKQLSILCSQE